MQSTSARAWTCARCLTHSLRPVPSSATRTLFRSSIHTRRKLHGAIVPDQDVQKQMHVQSQTSFHDYFSANELIDRGWLKNGLLAVKRTTVKVEDVINAKLPAAAAPTSQPSATSLDATPQHQTVAVQAAQPEDVVLPHRRRWLQKRASPQETTATAAKHHTPDEQLPLDASSRLTTAAAALPASASFRRILTTYLSLSKPRLSFLILLTTTSAYSLYPIPDILSSTTSFADANTTLSTSTLTLLFLTSGTFLSCASANTFNMLFETKSDALMTRTRNRPLVRGLISPRGALLFALATGLTGLTLLDFGTNPTVAGLSALNIFLYGFVYTPMKRISWLNTWVGAIVGGIPPLMGWAAAAGQAATNEHHSWRDLLLSESSIGGWLLAALLFAWQFPHFNSLSHNIRDDYKNAGHKMLAWMNPARNARVALRYSVAMFPICFGLYYYEIVNPAFLAISTACNLWMLRGAVTFYRFQGAQGSARVLFWASVWQLPLVLVGALVCKSGLWDGVFGSSEEPLSIYDPTDDDEDHESMADKGLAMSSLASQPSADILSDSDTRPRNQKWAMMGFKRPS